MKVLMLVMGLMIGVSQVSAHENEDGFAKCETPRILQEIMTGARKPAGRPEHETSVVSHLGHFRVHYDTTGTNSPVLTDDDENGIPDYIDSTCVYLEYAWDILVNQLEFKPPLSDNGAGGGDEVDCYIRDFLGGGYGFTEPESITGGPSPAYIFIDNDYSGSQYASRGYDGLKVSTAHEFFHTIHFGYVTDLNLSWWMEQTAVWMEDKAWDDVNDYFAYLNFFFQDFLANKTSLDTNSNFMYGAVVWPMFLTKQYGEDILRKSWEELSGTTARKVAVLDGVIPVGLAQSFNEFAVWNYFTDFRANTTDFYKDGDRFGYTVLLEQSEDETPAEGSLALNHLASRYIELLFVGNWNRNDALSVKVTSNGGGKFTSSVVFFNNPYDYRIDAIDEEGSDIPFGASWEKAVLVVSCTSVSGYNYPFSYEIEAVNGTYAANDEPAGFSILGAFPNPFNPSTTIDFTLSEPGQVSVKVFNASGQKVSDLYDGHLSAGDKRMLWKPDNLAGGVYFVTVTSPRATKTLKTLYLK